MIKTIKVLEALWYKESFKKQEIFSGTKETLEDGKW